MYLSPMSVVKTTTFSLDAQEQSLAPQYSTLKLYRNRMTTKVNHIFQCDMHFLNQKNCSEKYQSQ